MKLRIRKTFLAAALCCAFSSAAVAADWQLAGVTAFPSFSEFSRMAGRLGVALGNPILPALVISSQQERLKRTYGALRPNDSIWRFDYVDADSGGRVFATVYPCADRAATMLLENPGSRRLDDGTILLPQMGEREADVFVVYSKSGEFAAFAPTAALARRAIGEFIARPDRADPSPHLRFFLSRPAFARYGKADPLGGFSYASGEVAFDDRGLTLTAKFAPVPGEKPQPKLLDAVASALSRELPPAAVKEVVGRLAEAEKKSPASAAERNAALPELAKGDAPADVFCRSLYSHVRDVEIPRMRQTAKGAALAQLDSLRKAMPASAKDAAVVGALWRGADGSCRVTLRVTNGELANYGKAFAAFTASSLVGAEEKKK